VINAAITIKRRGGQFMGFRFALSGWYPSAGLLVLLLLVREAIVIPVRAFFSGTMQVAVVC
jgi:hypothetical protein